MARLGSPPPPPPGRAAQANAAASTLSPAGSHAPTPWPRPSAAAAANTGSTTAAATFESSRGSADSHRAQRLADAVQLTHLVDKRDARDALGLGAEHRGADAGANDDWA